MLTRRKVALAISVLIFGLSSGSTLGQTEVPVLESYPEHIIYEREGFGARSGVSGVAAADRKWENGRTLRVCFFSSGIAVRQLIATVAQEWSAAANLKFDFGLAPNYRNCLDPDGFSNIRIAFSSPGYWSYVGKESDFLGGPYVPSMNLFRFNIFYPDSRFSSSTVVGQAAEVHKGIIRHEFGHAIGLLHEHQNPQLACWDHVRFDGPGNAYEYLSGDPNYWPREVVDLNLRPITDRNPTTIGNVDRDSVMFYSLPPAIFKEGDGSPCYVKVNNFISASDKVSAATLYPAGPALAVNDMVVPAGLNAPAPQAAPALRENYEQNVLRDLESSDTFVRRDARGRLATFLSTASDEEKGRIFAPISSRSYRYQLGVAVAASAANAELSEGSKAQFRSLRNQTQDATLKGAIDRAVIDR